MSIVTITINGKNFKISCSEESKDKIMSLAEKLDVEIKDMSVKNQYASLELLLIMMALQHVDERQSQMNIVGGDVLQTANTDFQKQLSSIHNQLQSVKDKLTVDLN